MKWQVTHLLTTSKNNPVYNKPVHLLTTNPHAYKNDPVYDKPTISKNNPLYDKPTHLLTASKNDPVYGKATYLLAICLFLIVNIVPIWKNSKYSKWLQRDSNPQPFSS